MPYKTADLPRVLTDLRRELGRIYYYYTVCVEIAFSVFVELTNLKHSQHAQADEYYSIRVGERAVLLRRLFFITPPTNTLCSQTRDSDGRHGVALQRLRPDARDL